MYSWPLNFDEIPGLYLGKHYVVITLRVVDFLCKYNRQRRGVEENDLILFRRGSGGGLADVTNVFFFLNKNDFLPSSENRRRRSQIGQMLGM